MKLIKNINSIQIFHAVAETKNLTRAGRLLNISQSSLSYHIKKLESELCVQLFFRTPSGLELTQAGVLLARHVDTALSTIRHGLTEASIQKSKVRFAVQPMFSSRWLSFRLGELLDKKLDLTLTIQSHQNDYAFLDHPEKFADLGVQWGRGDWEDFHATRLWSERMLVVCSPEYLIQYPIEKLEDVAGCTLLHVDDYGMWEEWFENNDLNTPPSARQMLLKDRHFQLSSTINGLGLSLFADWLVDKELVSGALVSPFGESFVTDYAYFLIYPKERPLSEMGKFLHDYIIKMTKRDLTKRPARSL